MADEAVTPVVGTILILGITVLGMAGILYWGAPTIERIQAQNAQAAMVGEFEDLRSSSLALSVPDASRIPTVVLPSGTLELVPGTRIMVTVGHDGDYTACNLHVTGWSVTGTSSVAVSTADCRPATTLEVHQVTGGNTVRKTDAVFAGGVLTSASSDFSQGDWLFRLTNGNAVNPTVYAQSWLLSSDAFKWSVATSSGTLAAYLDAGAVFSEERGTLFLDKPPPIQEDAFGTNVYAFWVRSLLAAPGVSSISGAGSYQAFLALIGNHARVDTAEARLLRYDFQGDLAEGWCNALVLRNVRLGSDLYQDGGSYSQAATDPAYRCDQGDPAAVRSVAYRKDAAYTPFKFEMLHARIRASLDV